MQSELKILLHVIKKDYPVQESRVGRIFRQTDLNYSSWDARTADTKKNSKKSHLTGRGDDLKLLRYPYGYLEGLENNDFMIDRLCKTTYIIFLFINS